MYPERAKFVDRCLRGEVLVDDIDDYVDLWHEGGEDVSLHDFLGFTPEEYALWVERPDSIKFILNARQRGRPLDEFHSVPDA